GGSDAAGPQILGGRTRAALEREKTLVLRAIKDLEFDHAMGKTSDKDFAEMSARLRVRAAGLIGQLDTGAGYREQIEQEIEKRVGRTTTPHRASAVGTPTEGSPGAPDKARATSSANTCAACSTVNDADARFCKQCGAVLGGAA
ncbi:MAG: zinc ribbon domain-containing protein, partial [Acidobacteria bacterium]|nr:zinc ribbon domain-containing protein [Acidobacteriota bacterium]